MIGALRLIPAHAGKTATGATSSHITTAHPRSRGENSIETNEDDMTGGSSPLTRGKLGIRGDRRNAGLAHPRSRGENLLASISIVPS